MPSYTLPIVAQGGRAAALWLSKLSYVPSEVSGVERSSTAGQESVTFVDDGVFKCEKRARDDENTSLKARMKTDSSAARKIIKYKDLAETYFGMSVDAQRKLTRSENETRALEFEVSELNGQVDSLSNKLATANIQAEAHKAQVAELESLLELAMTGINQLQDRNEELEVGLSEANSDHRLLGYEERLRESQTMLHSAVSQVGQLTSKNEKLVDQKAALYDALSKSLATSGRKQKELEAENFELKAALAQRDAKVLSAHKELKAVREEAAEKTKAVEAAWDQKYSEDVGQLKQRLTFLRSEKARLRVEVKEHKLNAATIEKQKDTAEAELATCKADLQVMSLKLKDAQEDVKYAQSCAEKTQNREEACERHIVYLESLLPIQSEGARRLLSLGDKLEKAMAKSQHTRTSKLQDTTNRRATRLVPLQFPCDESPTPAPTKPMRKTSLLYPASSYVPVPGVQGTPYDPVPPMRSSNLVDVSEGEILFGSMGLTANPINKSLAEPRASRTGGAGQNRAPRVANRRRL